MTSFTEKKFLIPNLTGISAKTIEEHLKLYSGYVKHANLIIETIAQLKKQSDNPANVYALAEVQRRFSFEYNGIRNHEVYFESLEGSAKELSTSSTLRETITSTWNSFDVWLTEFKALAMTRGIGWAMLYYDRKDNQLLHAWIDEQHLGQLQDCTLILALDMWEHSFVSDYQPSGKKKYVEDFFSNLNWEIIEKKFSDLK